MAAKPETAAEVLADVRSSADMHERNGSMPFPSELRSICDRFELALSAQVEAVVELEISSKGYCCWAKKKLPEGKYLLYTRPAPARVTEEMVERAAKEVERATTAKGYGWSDAQFEVWWNKDPMFCERVRTWADFTGTLKQRRIHETRAALTAALEDGRPSIHMPRWASRIDLEVTGVRVERLQDISEADAMAEGIRCTGQCSYWWDGMQGDPHRTAADAFRALWESINGPDSWTANPWVWVVELRRIKP